MSIYIGNNKYKEIYLGSNKISEVYLGSNKIYGSATPPGPPPGTAYIGDKLYRVTEMPDGKIWLCENLDYGSSGVYYNNDESTYGWNGLKYGKLYNWNAAVAAANEINGWHLPTATEWDALATAVGGSNIAGNKLKSSTGWNGTDDYGFAALPAGYQSGSSTFSSLGSYAYFWTATASSSTKASARYFMSNPMYSRDYIKTRGYSVRLVKDAT